ncbi:MAG: hypothetical protein UMU76_08960 [Prosthecochloris sp.]|nr:hypothetical protein [Prosthecochloris sp.]
MQGDARADNRGAILELLESRVADLVEQLNDCRQENEELKSEISSMQKILRSCKLPVSGGGSEAAPSSELSKGFSYTEKLQVRQKLVLILQKIEMELRDERLD